MKLSTQPLDVMQNFPGWEKAPDFLKGIIEERDCDRVADIGGGAHPMIDHEYISSHSIDYWVIDISEEELNKTNPVYKKMRADVTLDTEQFETLLGDTRFDLIFSHMFLEHIENPIQAHKNFFRMLKPGGIAVHLYPSPNNLPLSVNRLLPERVSTTLLKIASPTRDLDGEQGKFPAYYKYCGSPSDSTRRLFAEIGYSVLSYTGYIGHGYYSRFRAFASIEKAARNFFLKYGIPLTSNCMLILQKPENPELVH